MTQKKPTETADGARVFFTFDVSYVSGTTNLTYDGLNISPGAGVYTESAPAAVIFFDPPDAGSFLSFEMEQA